MKIFSWLLKAAIFFILFAFALGNRHDAALHVWPGVTLQAPLMVVVLASFALGCLLGIAVMLPRWWRAKRTSQQLIAQQAQAAPAAPVTHTPALDPNPAELERHKIDPSLPVNPDV